MTKILLCIDDEPIRYFGLALALAPEILVVVTHKLQDVHFYLSLDDTVYDIVGICLDCDMPQSVQGIYYASYILNERNYPVAIVSLNEWEARKCHEILDEYATPNILLPVSDPDDEDSPWIKNVIDYFKGF